VSKGPRVLYIDIETSPGVSYFWQLKTHFIPVSNIVSSGSTLCFAARWEGEKKVHFHSAWGKGGFSAMIEAAWNLFEEADFVIHYNGKKFDVPTLNREFLIEGFTPPSDYHQIDLYQVVKSQFKLESYSLKFVLKMLDLENKLENKGMELWTGVLAGNREDQKLMKEYNIQDVEIMPALYEVLQPWVKSHPNRAMWNSDKSELTCPNCGGHSLIKWGTRKTRVSEYQRYRCNDCGTTSRGRKKMKQDDEGVLM